MSWAAEIAARQSRASTSVTALGRVSFERAGNAARATPAAVTTESAPPTRVVFLVAKLGKPRSTGSSSFASSCSSPVRVCVGVCVGAADGPGVERVTGASPEEPQAASRAATRALRRSRTGMGERGYRPPRGGSPGRVDLKAHTVAAEDFVTLRQSPRSWDSPGRGGPELCGASHAQCSVRRELFQRQPVS
jgi:hypothetical protein